MKIIFIVRSCLCACFITSGNFNFLHEEKMLPLLCQRKVFKRCSLKPPPEKASNMACNIIECCFIGRAIIGGYYSKFKILMCGRPQSLMYANVNSRHYSLSIGTILFPLPKTILDFLNFVKCRI